MITKPASGLKPLTSEEASDVVRNLWRAIEIMPKHRHNYRTTLEDCDICKARQYLINAFRTFKRLGD